MTRILIHETSLQRVQPRLPVLSPGDEWLILGKDGVFRLNGAEVGPDAGNPDIAWLSLEAFGARGFWDMALASDRLVWLQSCAAGFDHPNFQRLMDKGARLTTNHSQAVGMAEYVLWGVLNHFQNGPERAAEQAARRWTRKFVREVSGTRWLMIGFGAIGQAVGERARALGAHVTGVRRKPGDHPAADVMATMDQLPRLLSESDVVVVSLPLNKLTTDFVSTDFLAAMKPRSMFVNVGRGGLVDEDALLVALDAGKPEHALLDVFRTEPLPVDSWIWNHPRVTMTPHFSPMSDGLEARSDTLFIDNLTRFLAGKPLLNEAAEADVRAGAKQG